MEIIDRESNIKVKIAARERKKLAEIRRQSEKEIENIISEKAAESDLSAAQKSNQQIVSRINLERFVLNSRKIQ